MVAAKIHIEPADDDGQGAIGAHCDEEQSCVLKMRLCMDGDEDREAGDGDADGDQGEEETVLEFVGEVGYYHSESEGSGPWGHGVD